MRPEHIENEMGVVVDSKQTGKVPVLPSWVPNGALHYLYHTELGHPIRALAREAGCHASTILRQIRRIETRRDDPLVDAALRRLGSGPLSTETVNGQEHAQMAAAPQQKLPDDSTLTREALRILPRLCETGAVLAVAEEMENAVVVRDTASGGSTRTAVLSAAVAQAMALNDWIAATNAGRIVRYHITATGRSALARMVEQSAGRDKTRGFAEAATEFVPAERGWEEETLGESQLARRQRMRFSMAESPLIALSRRRDVDGKPFLSDALVNAGEHLREDFELAQMGARSGQSWDEIQASGSDDRRRDGGAGDASHQAQARVAAALAHLGPGLSDVALRCCCYLEGLETAEKRLGWSARSGKIVLRIALQRLKRYYDETIGPGGPMIG